MPVLPPRQDEGKRVMASFRVPEQLMERIREIAKEEHYEVTEVVLHAFRLFLATYDAEKKGGR